MESTTAVVLGGGRGTRLFPLTKTRSKPAVPVAGNYRLIDVTVSNCINSGIDRIYILTQFNSASLNRHVSSTYRFDNFSHGFVEILAAEQTHASRDWFQGTADAARKALPHLDDYPCRDVVILSGDHLYRMDFREFLRHHRESGADITIAVKPVSASRAGEFGILRADRSGRIVEFREKPKRSVLSRMKTDTRVLGLTAGEARRRPYLGSMGIYVFRSEALRETLDREPTVVDFARELIPQALERLRVNAWLYDGYWEDIGTIRSFYRAHMDLLAPDPAFNLFDPRSPLFTHPRFLAGSKLEKATIERSIINNGCQIGRARIVRSIVGVRSRIGPGAVVADSLVMGADHYEGAEDCGAEQPRAGIGPNARIRRAIVDKNVLIGRDVVIENRRQLDRYDDPEERYYIRDGIVVVPKGAVLPDGLRI
ncbi:MAG: glucose-1-phosphate adenylyltransferase [Candidatus Krumholzibacteriota bacterium]|nr:glucose-1-phosphate adenylyltransferase [Candidatus Krumholzibacteriota bacterium]